MTETVRIRIARGVYRQTSLQFRVAFKILAFLRSGKPSQYPNGDGADAYLTVHTREYFRELWKYGYHRVFDLVSNFSPARDTASLHVLSLGPRTEIELYYLWLFFGFR